MLHPADIFFSRRASRHLVVALTFIASLAAYLLTIEPDASYWDCPEYLVTAALLEVGHPPGNPVWTLTARIFSLFGGGSPEGIAIAVNISSAIFTALATAMLASVIFILLVRILPHGIPPLSIFPPPRPTPSQWSLNQLRAACAWGGAMCFGWADSPWFSAVEAEVYAMSLFLTALCVRLMVGWAFMLPGPRSRRQLLLIVYLTGLSIGVHQLNLLVIPALALIWLFRRRPGRIGIGRISLAILAGATAVGLILLGMMPGVLKIAGHFELACVNSLGLPLHSGVILFWGTAMLICWLLPFCMRRGSRLELLAWIPALLLTGYSSYMIILVRGAADPPMNEAAPATIFDLQSYLARDQYGSTPLFYGRTPKSRVMRRETIRPDGTPDYSRNALEEGAPHYAPTDSGYVLYEYARKPILTPELNMILPRLTSADPSDIQAYADWAGMTPADMEPVEISFAFDSVGNPVGRLLPDGTRSRETELRPTYLQQLRYLFGYQIGYMYGRYLMWNYSGRQNDRFAVGEVEHGNFLTGLPPIDDLMLGPQSKLPMEIGKENPGRNIYFMIPLLLGILGMVWLQRSGSRGRRANLVLAVLFLMTGVAIVVYLNQSPREPRERDYSFLGSLWTYAIWIACGMASLFRMAMRRKGKMKIGMILLASAVALGLPFLMLVENYDDHDRSGRHGVTDFATNFLESLEPEAIVFTNGDNFTFPLWWVQEVGGVRRDVTVINCAYLGTPWYVAQLRRPKRVSEGLTMQMPAEELRLGGFKFSRFDPVPLPPSRGDTLSASDATIALRDFYATPAASRRLPAFVRIANPEGGDPLTLSVSSLASGSSTMDLRHLAALDILASNAAAGSGARPVYWLSSLGASDFCGLRPFTIRTLHTRRLVYTDSLPAERRQELLDMDFRKALETRSGRRKESFGLLRHVYADDTYGQLTTNQRQNLIRLGGRLLEAGRPADALKVARLIDAIFPASVREYQHYVEWDSTIYEGTDLARLYIEGARRTTSRLADDYHYLEGYTLLIRERNRYAEWKLYRDALPARLKGVMTPKNLRKARHLQYVDSLLEVYDLPPSPRNKQMIY